MRLQALEKHAGEEKSMAVKIESGGWGLIFLIGVALVGYSLNRYGVIDLSPGTGGGEKNVSGSGGKGDASKARVVAGVSDGEDCGVRGRRWRHWKARD